MQSGKLRRRETQQNYRKIDKYLFLRISFGLIVIWKMMKKKKKKIEQLNTQKSQRIVISVAFNLLFLSRNKNVHSYNFHAKQQTSDGQKQHNTPLHAINIFRCRAARKRGETALSGRMGKIHLCIFISHSCDHLRSGVHSVDFVVALFVAENVYCSLLYLLRVHTSTSSR